MILIEMEGIIKVEPVIIYPPCLKTGMKQDCFHCELGPLFLRNSPRCMCARRYPNHKWGCPNYDKKKGCPPGVPMFNSVCDLSEPIYAIYNIFDLKEHVDRMRGKHSDWSKRQLKCCLYWQGTARKKLKERIKIFKRLVTDGKYFITAVPEAMGVQVTETMKKVGIELEWPPINVAYQIALAGRVLHNNMTKAWCAKEEIRE